MSDFSLSSFLPYRLAVIAERVSRRLSVEYDTRFGLSVAEWRVMAHLTRGGSLSVRDIVDAVNLDKPRVSRAVTRLEAMGFVEKVPGAHDGRLVEISLTEAGQTALAEIIPAAQSVETRLTQAVGARDLEVFLKVLERLHGVLDADPDARPRSRLDLDGL